MVTLDDFKGAEGFMDILDFDRHVVS